MISVVADIADIHIFKGFCLKPYSFPIRGDLAASTTNIRAFCGSHRGFLKASCDEYGDGPLFYGHGGPVGVILLLVVCGELFELTLLCRLKSLWWSMSS